MRGSARSHRFRRAILETGEPRARCMHMTATFAPSPWPAPAVAARTGVALRREVGSKAAATQGMQWVLRRNCSIAPRQLVIVYLSLCAVSLAIAAGFWMRSAHPR